MRWPILPVKPCEGVEVCGEGRRVEPGRGGWGIEVGGRRRVELGRRGGGGEMYIVFFALQPWESGSSIPEQFTYALICRDDISTLHYCCWLLPWQHKILTRTLYCLKGSSGDIVTFNCRMKWYWWRCGQWFAPYCIPYTIVSDRYEQARPYNS